MTNDQLEQLLGVLSEIRDEVTALNSKLDSTNSSLSTIESNTGYYTNSEDICSKLDEVIKAIEVNS